MQCGAALINLSRIRTFTIFSQHVISPVVLANVVSRCLRFRESFPTVRTVALLLFFGFWSRYAMFLRKFAFTSIFNNPAQWSAAKATPRPVRIYVEHRDLPL